MENMINILIKPIKYDDRGSRPVKMKRPQIKQRTMNKMAPRKDKKKGRETRRIKTYLKDDKKRYSRILKRMIRTLLEWIITVLECSLSIILMVFFHSSTLDWMGKVKQSDRALYMDTTFSGLTVTCT
jgi:hypothetical protein